MHNVVLILIIGMLLFSSSVLDAQNKGKTIIIKQHQQDNGDWKSDTIGKLDFNTLLDFDFDKHLNQSLSLLDSLLPNKDMMDSMVTIFNHQINELDISLNEMSKKIVSHVPKFKKMRLKLDSVLNSKLNNTQIKVVTGDNRKKVMMVNGEKIEIEQNIDKNKITITYYTDQDGEFSFQLLNNMEEVLYEFKDKIEAGKFTHSFSTNDIKSGHYLIKIIHNHLFLLEQLQIMHN